MRCILFSTALVLLSATASAQAACPPQTVTPTPSPASASPYPPINTRCINISHNVPALQYRGMNVINQAYNRTKGWKDATDWWTAFQRVNNMTGILGYLNNSTNNLSDPFNMTNNLDDPEYAASRFNAVRLFSTTDAGVQHLANALQPAQHRNLSIHAGVWSGGDMNTDRFATERVALNEALSKYGCGNIAAVSVGNEDLYFNLSAEITQQTRVPLMDIGLLVNQAQEIRNVLDAQGCCNVPVTHTDSFGEWLKTNVTEPLINQLDFLTVNIYPYWEGVSIDQANATFWDHLESVKNMASQYGKEVWVGETGWPVTGDVKGDAVPSVDNLQRYWNEVGCQLMKRESFFWFAEWDDLNNPSFGVTKQNGQPVIGNMSCNWQRNP